MSVSNIIDTINTPEFAGELFTADAVNTPLLSLIGGLSGGYSTGNEEFPTSVLYNYPNAKQPEISELEAVNAPPASFITKAQATNVVQIFQESLEITYARKATSSALAPIQNPNGPGAAADELEWQIAQRLKIVARDIEHTFLNGSYQKRASVSQANKTRGLIELCTVNSLDADGEALTAGTLKGFFRQLADNGAYLDDMIIFVNSTLKQALTDIYAAQLGFGIQLPKNTAGLNITEIETDFFKCGIVYDRFMPQDSLLIADVAHIVPVFQTIPGKGNFFVEELSKTGASEKFQLYGHIGLGHGPAFLHGVIKNIAV